MSADLVQDAPETDSPPTPPPAGPRRRAARWLLIAAVVLAVVLLGLGATLRFGARTDAGRALIMHLANGLRLGPVGRLEMEGLQGDIFHDFTVRRLAIVDRKGPWLDASNVAVVWDSSELLRRRFHAERIGANLIRVLRRPILEQQPQRRNQRLPVTILLDQVRARLQTLPDFSVRPGLWDLQGQVAVARNGAAHGRLDAQSLMHAGDGLALLFKIGEQKRVELRADAVEASGGALAGALGLAADQRLVVHARADGTTEAGRLDLAAVSGTLSPLRANAVWDKAGAHIDAYALLTASRLTRFVAERVGPEAHLVMNARQSRGDLYDLDGVLTAQNASVAVRGPIDWRARNTPGLNVKLAVADLSRWVPFPTIGPAQASGVATGDLGRFRYQGFLEGQRLSAYGYALARAAGPATFTHSPGEWRLQANLSGAGGAGTGLVAALLGPRPQTQLDGARIADGRFLFRELKVNGSGVRVDASGGEGLFGGLSFKGQAEISNLAAAHPGAHGLVKASWSAGEGRGARLWNFSFDASASNFASGYAEADHLLGASPHLKAQASYGASTLTVARADLSGGALAVTTKGVLGPRGTLNFDGDWSAKGPFHAGPIEIAGQAKGVGRIAGTFGAPRVDLDAQLAALDFGRLIVTPAKVNLTFLKGPQGFDGAVAVNGGSAYGPAAAKAGFRFAGNGLDLSNIIADAGGVKASGSLSLRSGAPSSADLKLAVGPGAFLTGGHIGGAVQLQDRPGGAVANVALDGQDVAAAELPSVLRTIHLKAAGPLARLPFQVAADSNDPISWRFAGSGLYTQAGALRQVALSGSGRLRRADLRTLQPAIFRFDAGGRTADLRVAVGGGQLALAGRQAGQALQARATLSKVSLSAFNPELLGAVSGNLTLAGAGARLQGELDASLEGARSRDAPADLALNGRVRAQLANAMVRLDASAANAQGLRSELVADVPAEATAEPFRIALVKTRPMRGQFSADGELRPLWDLFFGGGQTLSGRVVAQGTLAGTLNDPRANGQASLTGGRFHDISTGLSLENLTAQTEFIQDAVHVRQFSGSDGHGGTLSGQGTVDLLRGGASNFQLVLSKFRLIDNDYGRASASGTLTVTRDVSGHAKLSGALRVDRADIVANTPTPTGVVPMDVVEIHRKPREGEEVFQPRLAGPAVALDVTIRSPGGVFVRGKGLNVELSLDAHVGGTTAAPELTGVARVVLGSYDFAGQRFDFDERGKVILATHPDQIRLDLTATRQNPTLTAVVRVTGTAAKPEISLSSLPVLPQDEVLAQVLFGTSAAQLAPAQAAELASALASLSGGGGFDILGHLRQFAGLDRLALGGTTATGPTVSGGKYIGNNFYVELTGGGRGGPSADVEWRVRRNLSIISQVGGIQGERLSIRFRKTY